MNTSALLDVLKSRTYPEAAFQDSWRTARARQRVSGFCRWLAPAAHNVEFDLVMNILVSGTALAAGGIGNDTASAPVELKVDPQPSARTTDS